MPCTDSFADDKSRRDFARRAARIEAMLCAFVKTLNNLTLKEFVVFCDPEPDDNPTMLKDVLSLINWKKAGVSHKYFRKWLREHQRRDRNKRHQAQTEKEIKRLRKQGLKKLTLPERAALGVTEE